MREGLTYEDVLIVPRYSSIETRDDIDVTSEYFGKRRIPIISAPMDYVTGYHMAHTLAALNAYGVISRFGDHLFPSNSILDIGVAVGAKEINLENIKHAHSVCIDVAHGHHALVKRAIQTIKETYPDKYIIAGNVATPQGFDDLVSWGADAIRVGIGAGSACSTRENTGIGVPQLTAVLECARVRDELNSDVTLIADGGIQKPGDIVKALAAGADAVMLGNMLAGHEESPGVLHGNPETGFYKDYRGQSLLGSNGARNAPEGVEGTVPHRGFVSDTLNTLINYLKSGMSYVGASTIEELQVKADFIRVSPGTFNESRTRI